MFKLQSTKINFSFVFCFTTATFSKEVMFLPLSICLSACQKVVNEFWWTLCRSAMSEWPVIRITMRIQEFLKGIFTITRLEQEVSVQQYIDNDYNAHGDELPWRRMHCNECPSSFWLIFTCVWCWRAGCIYVSRLAVHVFLALE